MLRFIEVGVLSSVKINNYYYAVLEFVSSAQFVLSLLVVDSYDMFSFLFILQWLYNSHLLFNKKRVLSSIMSTFKKLLCLF